MRIGLFAPHERYGPDRLADLAARAERAGFDAVWTSDHFHPWWHSGAECGAAWPWLGAALERTGTIRMGTGVTAPVARYHPGLLAQSTATLGAMYPGRVHLTLATGEALNERPLGYDWPPYEERRKRLIDACEIVDRLWDGGFHDYDGHHWDLDGAKLYTRPDRRPPLYVAGNGPETTAVAGRYADGFLTLVDVDTFRGTLAPALRDGADRAGRDPDAIDRIKQASVAYAEEYDAALDAARFWSGTLAVDFSEDVHDPREIEERGAAIPREEVADWGLVTTDPADVRALLDRHEAAGFDEVELLVASPDPEQFVEEMGESVLSNGRSWSSD
jgi:coenzyme F420-dependent glucose-6-phosphate dehydrogenase